MYAVCMPAKPSNVLSIPAPPHRLAKPGKGRGTRFGDKRRQPRCHAKAGLRKGW